MAFARRASARCRLHEHHVAITCPQSKRERPDRICNDSAWGRWPCCCGNQRQCRRDQFRQSCRSCDNSISCENTRGRLAGARVVLNTSIRQSGGSPVKCSVSRRDGAPPLLQISSGTGQMSVLCYWRGTIPSRWRLPESFVQEGARNDADIHDQSRDRKDDRNL